MIEKMEENDSIMILDANKLCRICLSEKSLPICLISNDFSVLKMIEKCTNVKFTLESTVPSAICEDCFYRLNVAIAFKRECEESEVRLQPSDMQQPAFSEIRQSNSTRKFTKTEEGVDSNYTYETESQPDHLRHKIEFFNVSPDEQLASNDTNAILSDSNSMASYTEWLHTPTNNIIEVEELDRTLEKVRVVQIKKRTRESRTKQAKTPKKSLRTLRNRAVLKENGRNCRSVASVDDNNGTKLVKRGKLKAPEQCPDCGKLFSGSGYLETHMRIHTGEKPFECEVCKLRFTQTTNLALHMRVHTGEKPFQCEICSKRCTTSSNLKAHLRTHSDTRDFACNQCDRTFKSSLQLSNHMKTHSGIRNLHCEICNKGFYKRAYLNVHIRTAHNGEKRHECSECGKMFTNTSNLICHFRIHTGEKPFVCDICNSRFNQSSALLRHKKLHVRKQLNEEMDESIVIDSINHISDTEQEPVIVSDDFLSPSMQSIQSDVELNVDDSQQLSITDDCQPLETRLTHMSAASTYFGPGIVQLDYDRDGENIHDNVINNTFSNYMRLQETVHNLDMTRSMPDYSRGHSTIYSYAYGP